VSLVVGHSFTTAAIGKGGAQKMTIEYRNARTEDWQAPEGIVSGTHIKVDWPIFSGVFHDCHSRFVVNSPQYNNLANEIFRYQLAGEGYLEQPGNSIIDRLSKDINSTFNMVASLSDKYNSYRTEISDKMRECVLSNNTNSTISLSEAQVFGFSGITQSAISGVASYLDLIGKYFYLLMFRRIQCVDENTGHRRRSYFREFQKIFLNEGAPQGRCNEFENLLINQNNWINETFRTRDFIQHAGFLNPLLWKRNNFDYNIDFSGGCHELPLHTGAFLSNENVALILNGLNSFNDETKVFIELFCNDYA